MVSSDDRQSVHASSNNRLYDDKQKNKDDKQKNNCLFDEKTDKQRNKDDKLKRYYRHVFETSEIRFDEENLLSQKGSRKLAKSNRPSLASDESQDAATMTPSLISSTSSLAEIDADAPLPRADLFVEKKLKSSSRASKVTLKDSRTGLANAFARLRGSDAAPLEVAPVKHEKPRTGCEGFCIPGYCRGISCKLPPDNQPALKGVLNCASLFLTSSCYESLRRRKTKSGVTFDDVIQYGVDQWKWNMAVNKAFVPGVFFPVNAGAVAFDADCYSVFGEFFDDVISARHNGYPTALAALSGLAASKDASAAGLAAGLAARHPRDCNPKHVTAPAADAGYIAAADADDAAAANDTAENDAIDADADADFGIAGKSGKNIVLWCGVQASRNIVGFPFVPLLSRAQRRDLNFLVSGVLDDLPSSSATAAAEFSGGKYFDLDEIAPPLSVSEEAQHHHHHHHAAGGVHPIPPPAIPHLRLLKPLRPNPLREPHLTKDFPDGRDVWAIDEGRFYVVRNVRDHLSFVATDEGCSFRDTFVRWLRRLKTIESLMAKSHLHFAFDDHLGYLTPNPSNLGTAMTLAVRMRLPALHRFPLFDEILIHLRLRRATDLDFEPDLPMHHRKSSVYNDSAASSNESFLASTSCEFTIFNADRLGLTEVEAFRQFVASIRRLVGVEETLASAEVVVQENFPRQINIDYFTTPANESPNTRRRLSGKRPAPFSSDFPDLKNNVTMMAQTLRDNKFDYEKWSKLVSKDGFSFTDAIQIGVDHPTGRFSHRNDLARVGMIVGDEDCYQAFKPFFDEFIPALHWDYHEDARHLTLWDLSGVEVDDCLDPRVVVGVHVETRRNISGFKMSTKISREDRRLLERIAVHCLGYLEHQSIEFEVKGRYFQYGHLEHMKQTVDEMGIKCLYFPLEDRVLYKKAGLLRDWPDARGYWCNNDRTVFCNVNEVDHLVFTSVERTGKLKSVFQRHRLVLDVFELRLKELASKRFMHDPHLGYLTACPGEVGTGTIIYVQVKLKHLVRNERMFLRVLRKHRLRQQPINAETWSLYNVDTLGYAECDVVGLVYEGCKKIIELDKFLGSLDSTDWIEDETKLPLRKIAHLIHCDMSWYAPLLFDAEIEDEEEMSTAREESPTTSEAEEKRY